MATADTRSEVEIAKSVKRLEKLVSMHGDNPAEIKKQQQDRKQILDKEKILQERWLISIEEAKKQKMKERQTTKGLFSLIKNDAMHYFDTEKSNQITWGNLWKTFTGSMRDWFDAASKQRTVLGATLRLGASLWKATHTHIIGTIKNVFSKIGSHMREVLGELAEVFDVVKDAIKSAFSFIKDSIFGFMEKVPPADRKRNKLLQYLVNHFRRQEKRELISLGKESNPFNMMSILGGLAIATAFVLGAVVRKFILPFEMAYKAMRLGGAFKAIFSFITSFNFFAKIIFGIKWTFIKWGRYLENLLGGVGWISKFGGIVGKLFGAFAKGFKIFGWPLTIAIAVYDFITGIMKSSGSFLDRLKGGFTKALMGIIELPIRFVSWVAEGLLKGLFGIEVDGLADKILDPIKGFINFWVDTMFGPLLNFVEAFWSKDGNIFEKFWAGIMAVFDGWGKWYDDYIKPVLNFLGIGGNEEEVDTTGTLRTKRGNIDISPGGGVNSPQNTLLRVSQAEADKKVMEQKQTSDNIVSAIQQQTTDTIKGVKGIADNTEMGSNNNTIIAGGGGGAMAAAPELPDGLYDQNGIALQNAGGQH
jgi:hypothetical protein